MNLINKIKSMFIQPQLHLVESGKLGSEMHLKMETWIRPDHGVSGTRAYIERLNDGLDTDRQDSSR